MGQTPESRNLLECLLRCIRQTLCLVSKRASVTDVSLGYRDIQCAVCCPSTAAPSNSRESSTVLVTVPNKFCDVVESLICSPSAGKETKLGM